MEIICSGKYERHYIQQEEVYLKVTELLNDIKKKKSLRNRRCKTERAIGFPETALSAK